VIKKILTQTQPVFIYGAMVSALIFFVLGSYLYLFKDAWDEYALMKETRTTLQETVDSGSQLSSAILQSRQRVDALVKELHGENPELPVNQTIALTIDRLDRISAQHDIQLISVIPDTLKRLDKFEELPFSIEVIGSYQQLADWLQEIETKLSPMVVKHFEIMPTTGKEQLTMRLEMISYRVPEQVI
jgi:type IV pilus assembly protein PilO